MISIALNCCMSCPELHWFVVAIWSNCCDCVRLIFSISLHFDSFCFLLSRLAKVKVKGKALRPKAPEHSVVLWSPRHQHQNHPAMDWLFGKGSSIDQLIVCLYTIIHLCFVCRPVRNTTGMETSLSPCPSWPCRPRGAGSLGWLGTPQIYSPTI